MLERMECLSLQLCNIAASAADELVANCCNSKNKCHFLDLDFSGIPADKSSSLIDELLKRDQVLTYLDLRRIDEWKDTHNKYLESIIQGMQLTHLRFTQVEFGKYGAALLAKALGANCSLRSVLIGDGPIGDEGSCFLQRRWLIIQPFNALEGSTWV